MNDTNSMAAVPNRCRLVLVARFEGGMALADAVSDALSGGDVASLIVAGPAEDPAFQRFCETVTGPAQAMGIAVMVANDTRTMGRCGADGVHVDQGNEAIGAAIGKFSPRHMVGAGGLKTRHNALVVGELQPDYVFFGKLDGDIRPEAHPRNLDLANWWSAMVEIPCIVMGGSALESVADVAKSGAEFVALSSAIFSPDSSAGDSPAQRVMKANAILDDEAPQFEDA